MSTTTPAKSGPHFERRIPSVRGEPAWNIATLYPPQGEWTEEEYLDFQTNRLVEFSDGFIEVLPVPKLSHQRIVLWLLDQLRAFVLPRRLGEVSAAPVPVRLRAHKYREPDVFYLSRERLARTGDYPDGADLVVEVVSEGAEARQRDIETKPIEYAAAGIQEYWIVDPEKQEITVLTLEGTKYRTHGVFRGDEEVTSVLLDGFSVRAADVFAAGNPPA